MNEMSHEVRNRCKHGEIKMNMFRITVEPEWLEHLWDLGNLF